MLTRLIASSPDRAPRSLLPSGVAVFLAHVAAVAGAVWTTLRPDAVADATPAVLIEWPQAAQHDPPSPRLNLIIGPGGAARDIPIDVPRSLPSVDIGAWLNPEPAQTGATLRGEEPTASSGADGPWSLTLVEEQPALLAGPAPRYPEPLRRAGREGRVMVQAVIDTLGRTEAGSVTIVESPDPGFDAPAREYVQRAVFRPARVHGRAVRVLVQVPIDFTLTGLHRAGH